MTLRRQVSTQPEKVRTFFSKLRDDTATDGGYAAILEVCGFNDWLLALLTGRLNKVTQPRRQDGAAQRRLRDCQRRKKNARPMTGSGARAFLRLCYPFFPVFAPVFRSEQNTEATMSNS